MALISSTFNSPAVLGAIGAQGLDLCFSERMRLTAQYLKNTRSFASSRLDRGEYFFHIIDLFPSVPIITGLQNLWVRSR
jgi:hypothetical protein